MCTSNLYRSVIALIAVLIIVCSWYEPLQDVANEQVDAGLRRAVTSFASARALNAGISILQGTELSAQPLGVGITVTVGEALDPVNDLVERFSEWMLIASVAFGVQKMLLLIGSHWVISLIVSALATAWALLHVYHRRLPWLSRVLIVLVLVRFAIPAATLGSDLVFNQILAADYTANQEFLELTQEQIDQRANQVERHAQQAEKRAQESPNTDETGLTTIFNVRELWNAAKGWASTVSPPIPSIHFDDIAKISEQLPDRVITLIAIFFMQTLLLPLVLLWALYRIAISMIRVT